MSQVNVTVSSSSSSAVAEFVQYTRQKGKGVTQVVRALEGINRGASSAILAGALKGAARAAIVMKGAELQKDAIAQGIADGMGVAYQLAFFTVATLANVTTVASVDDMGKVNRAGWVELRRDLLKSQADSKGSALKAIDAGLALWAELQGMADAVRASRTAAPAVDQPAAIEQTPADVTA